MYYVFIIIIVYRRKMQGKTEQMVTLELGELYSNR